MGISRAGGIVRQTERERELVIFAKSADSCSIDDSTFFFVYLDLGQLEETEKVLVEKRERWILAVDSQ